MKKQTKPWNEYGRYGTVGIELVLSIVFGYWGGHWLDAKIGGGHGYLTVFGSIVGIYAGFRAPFMAAKHMQEDIMRQERRDRGEDPWQQAPPSPRGESAPTSPATRHAPADPHDEKRHDPR